MNAIRVVSKVGQNGILTISGLPLQEGESVEVIVLHDKHLLPGKQTEHTLRGRQPYRFDEPFEPVSEGDWEAAQ